MFISDNTSQITSVLSGVDFYSFPRHTGTDVPLKNVLSGYSRYDPAGTGGFFMKTVELKIGNQTAQFTTKSLTYNGREYFYSRMTGVANDPVNHNYAFSYDGQVIVLHYDEKDLRILNAIFGQVKNLARQTASFTQPQQAVPQRPQDPLQMRRTLHGQQQMQQAPQQQMQQFQQPQAQQVPQQPSAPQVQTQTPLQQQPATQVQTQTPPQQQPAPQVQTQTPPAQTKDPFAADNAPLSKAELKARKKAEKERLKAEKRAAKGRDRKTPSAVVTNDDEHAAAERTPEEKAIRKEKIKKSLIVFGIIIAAFALLSILWFVKFGTSDKPTMGPNSTQSQSYDDIDELIDELQ